MPNVKAHHEKYIKENYKSKTITQIAKDLGIDYFKVYYVVNRTIKGISEAEMLEDIEDEPRTPIQRPPAIYSNPQYYKL
jgi:hypothetical protein